MKNKLLTALLALVVAYGLWLYVITVVDPNSSETYYNIPVVFQNEMALTERNLMVTTEAVPTVTLRLSGNRTDLAELNSANITLAVDLSGIYDPGSHSLMYQINYPGDLPSNAFTVISNIPGRIDVEVERRAYKEVPVEVRFSGQLSDDYISQPEELDFSTVTVRGPSSVVEQIEYAVIDVDLTGREESINESFRYTLCNQDREPVDARQVTTDVAEVNLRMRIQRVQEVPLRLTVIAGGGATESTSLIEIEPSSIRVSGSDAVLAELKEINLGTVNLADLVEPMVNQAYAIRLPDDVINLTGVQEARVSIRFPSLQTKQFQVTDIRLLNVPEGMDVELVTQELQVSIRGPVTLMGGMKETDLYVTVDLTDATVGANMPFDATVVIANGFGSAGVVNKYSVYLTIQEASGGRRSATNRAGG